MRRPDVVSVSSLLIRPRGWKWMWVARFY
ncbi:uncharacterized, partial [Tachysurus ichikawai]